MVNGGKYKQKELVTSPVLVDGQLSIHHTIYKTSEYLAPDWVSPKHPNLTMTMGCWLSLKVNTAASMFDSSIMSIIMGK